MKTIKITLIIIFAIIIAACSSQKKSTKTVSSTSTPTNTTSTGPFLITKPTNGVYVPGNEELTAIQLQYKDVTFDKLKDGYFIYSQGACINCHRAQNIYVHAESQWKNIVDDMALRANISDSQKDAVYKYVLAIKATQPK